MELLSRGHNFYSYVSVAKAVECDENIPPKEKRVGEVSLNVNLNYELK